MSDRQPFAWSMAGGFVFSVGLLVSSVFWQDDNKILFFLTTISVYISTMACLVPMFDSYLRSNGFIKSKGAEFGILVAIGFVVMTLVWAFCLGISKIKWTDKIENYGQFGDFMGGLFNPILSAITLIIVFLAFRMQRKELENSELALKKNINVADLQRQDNAKGIYINHIENQLRIHAREYERINAILKTEKNLSNDLAEYYLVKRSYAAEMANLYSEQLSSLVEEIRILAKIPKYPGVPD